MKFDAIVHIQIRMVIDADEAVLDTCASDTRRAVRPLARAFAERVVNANQCKGGAEFGDPSVTEWSLDVLPNGLADAWPMVDAR